MKNIKKLGVLSLLLANLFVTTSPVIVHSADLAPVMPVTTPGQWISYSAKFSCGPMNVDSDVVKGDYATSVNIHNPNFKTVNFLKKVVIATPERGPNTQVRGYISEYRKEYLKADEAFYVDCKEIRGFFPATAGTAVTSIVAPTRHIEGFVVVYVYPEYLNDGTSGVTGPSELDVVTKYTARHRKESIKPPKPGTAADVATDVESFDVEEIVGKRINMDWPVLQP